MSDAGPSGSGRGDGAAAGASGRGGGRKPKFTPTVPARRKKAEGTGLGGVTAADAAAANEDFKDLIKAAEQSSTWQRGRGRGRGGVGRGGGQAQAFQVAFGGSTSDRPSLPDAKPTRYYAVPAGGGSGGGAARAGGPRVKAEPKPGEERGVAKEGGDPGDEDVDADGDAIMEPQLILKPEKKFFISQALDYNQYYPTTLPLREPGAPEEEEELEGGGIPKDLAITADYVPNVAADLGLMSLHEQDQLFLVQLPSILPISQASKAAAWQAASAAAAAAPAAEDGAGADGAADGGGGAGTSSAPSGGAAAASKKSGAGAPAGSRDKGCSLKELPSGCIGKLLVMKSGKVKMQVGEVLLDVSQGLPCCHHMDVSALNSQANAAVFLGTVTKRMVVSPDIWQLMEDAQVPRFRRAGEKQDGAAARPAKANGEAHPEGDGDGEDGTEAKQDEDGDEPMQ